MTQIHEADLRGFAAHWVAKDLSAGTLSEYLRCLRNYFTAHPETLTLLESREYVAEVMGRSRSHARYVARALKAYSKYLAGEYAEPDVLAKLVPPQEPVADPSRTKVATAEQVARILEHITNTNDNNSKRDHAIISVMYSSGMRRSEVARMQWQYIDLVEGMITIPITKNKKVRTICLSPGALRSLRRHARDFKSEDVWPAASGPLKSNGMGQMIQRRTKAAGMPLTAHSFRRGMAVDWLRKGGSETYLRRKAGWNTPRMVERYTELVADEEALAEQRRLYG